MNVPPLKALCTGKIITEIWTNRVNVDIFVSYAVRMAAQAVFRAEELRNIQKDYLEEIENIFTQIMELSMPDKIKLRLCAAMLNLEQDAFSCFDDAGHLFVSNKKDNLLFFMSKLYFSPTGLIDRSKTIVRNIFESCGELKINYQNLSRYCCLDKAQITEFIRNYKHNNTLNFNEVFKKLLKQNVSLYSYAPDKLVEEAVKGSSLIFEYMYDKCTDIAKPRWLCRMLILILSSGNTCDGSKKRLKIIFIYERLNRETWENVIIKYGECLVNFFLMTEQIDYCIHFYKQVCLFAPQHCHEILANAFDNVYSCDDYEHSTKIFKKLNEETFFSIWFQTPTEIKNRFIRENSSIYQILCFKDYGHISIILNDPTLTEENKNHLIDFLIVSYKCYSDEAENEVLLKKLVKEFRNDSDFVDVPTVKLILEIRFFYMYHKIETGTFLSDNDLIKLKSLVSQDGDFIKNVVKNHIKFSYLINVTEDALKFKFGDKKTELLQYVTEKFVYEEDFICVFHLVVEEMKYFDVIDDPSHKFIVDLFRDATVKEAIKKVLKETNLFEDYLQRIIGPETDRFLVLHKWNPYRDEHKPYFFQEFLSKAEIRERIKSYLLSDTGLKDIMRAYIITEHYDLQTVDKEHLIIADRSSLLFCEYWLKPYNLKTEFINYLFEHVRDIYQKYFKHLNEEQLLPNQSIDDNGKILNAFYKIFVSELLEMQVSDIDSDNLSAYTLINKLNYLNPLI